MLHQEVQKSSSRNPSSEANRSRFAPRPVTVQAQEESQKAPTQQEMENEAFDQSKVEAFGLQLKEKSGAITSEEQERLGVLQASMDDFWAQRLESAARFGYNYATIPVYSPDRPASAPVQPQVAPIQAKSPVGQPNDEVEQQRDRIARLAAEMSASVEQRSNQTGLPDALKAGVEQLAGISLDHVRVHYNSVKPAQLDALAFTQGRDIHVAPGQEQHLPHEAWHVVQQKQERVKPTMQMKEGVPVNDDKGLEHEADVMGTKALHSPRPARLHTLAYTQGSESHASYHHLMGAKAAGLQTTEPTSASTPIAAATGNNIQLKPKSLRERVKEKMQQRARLTAREMRFAGSSRPSPKALTAEIERRNKRRIQQNEDTSREIGYEWKEKDGNRKLKAKRPQKPPNLEGTYTKDGRKVDLTAHHLVPYNQLRESFASAVKEQDLTAMQNFLSFSDKASSDSSEAYRALAFQKEHKPTPKFLEKENKLKDEQAERGKTARVQAVQEELEKMSAEERTRKDANRIAQQRVNARNAKMGASTFHKDSAPESSRQRIKGLFKATAWASHNVFMGPAPDDRLDDPKEGLDARYLRQGQLTKSSVMAREIHRKGFSGIDPVDFNLSVQSAHNEADGLAKQEKSGTTEGGDDNFVFGSRPLKGGTREYKPEEWMKVGDKQAQVGKDQGNRFRKWAGKNNWQKLQRLGFISKEEAEEMKASVAARREKKHADFVSGVRRSRDN